MANKICKRCGVEKPISEMAPYKHKGVLRYKPYCIPCWKLQDKEKHAAYYQKNKEVVKNRVKKYTSENTEKVKQSRSTYYKNNRERIDAEHKQYNLDNPEVKKRIVAKHYNKTKEAKAVYQQQYCKDNIEKKREWTRNHRARKRGLEGFSTPEDIADLWVKQEGKCVYCGIEFTEHLNYEVDHIIPASREGSTQWPSNLQLLCKRCNVSKNDKTHEEYIDYLNIVLPM